MTIDNDYIAEQFSLLSKLMDIHGENSFKSRSYSSAAFTLEKLPPLEGLPLEKITAIKGIGDAIGKKILEIQQTGELRVLKEIVAKTPTGIIEMLQIKGLGPKKIATIWKDMEVESIGELLYACQENRLLLFKGFGEKTQQNVREAIEFRLKHTGSHLYAEVEALALALDAQLKQAFPTERFELTGDFRRQLEVVSKLQWVTTADAAAAKASVSADEGVAIEFIHTAPEDFVRVLFETSCSGEFLEDLKVEGKFASEEELFAAAGKPYVSPVGREQKGWVEKGKVIVPGDIRAVIHSHSTWSDGSNTLEEMAAACIEKGYEYLVISDHSKSAFYANGLKEDRIKEQQAQIEELNRKLAPFTIFKSIECDILSDGKLDYTDDVLATFDLVIASVHSNLKMSQEKAMSRLLRAIENPYTTILGHMTGRLLLSRPGYPVDHKAIIDACVQNNVVIELNAHPRRLDMDWRYIGYALEQGAMISIDPDAHSVGGIDVIRYGVLAAQKAGVTAEQNLSSFGLEEFKEWLLETREAKGI
ncbi:DNA polymerase/3'-5' exonuclease PolX [Puia dinghuensis]|uniref:DNA polymerase/3'-5' exonuclease PolX n=1 Tax=Puia dinghuensis TaxID=1792502 RepID=A0A8J2UD72_9BACT|nr:DNA polymerase/3'-5' exonuclease PolX [Puia dinghuensis]GGB01166.1 DNA polymerase/3'-5' exonuclease PolX [Puia dinghuensis]